MGVFLEEICGKIMTELSDQMTLMTTVNAPMNFISTRFGSLDQNPSHYIIGPFKWLLWICLRSQLNLNCLRASSQAISRWSPLWIDLKPQSCGFTQLNYGKSSSPAIVSLSQETMSTLIKVLHRIKWLVVNYRVEAPIQFVLVTRQLPLTSYASTHCDQHSLINRTKSITRNSRNSRSNTTMMTSHRFESLPKQSESSVSQPFNSTNRNRIHHHLSFSNLYF